VSRVARGLTELSEGVKLDWEIGREQRKVSVNRQDRHTVAFRDSANHEVGVRPLNSMRAARVEELGGALVIDRPDWQVWKLAKMSRRRAK
jgi:hypothetical protein